MTTGCSIRISKKKDLVAPHFFAMKLKVHELRSKTKSDLMKQLDEMKSELTSLRVAKVTGGAASKLSKM